MGAEMETSALTRLLDRADAERAAGRGEDAARLYGEATVAARESGDLPGRTRAVLGLAATHVFGTDPGWLPAELYDVLARTTDDAGRARVAAALARCWAYSGNEARGAPFAEEALRRAELAGDAGLVAEALDATLACHWGPDDLETRIALGGRLDEVAAHVLDPEARLQAHLWSLQVACEALDVPAIHRQLRALERLSGEGPRARFFSTTRRLMYDLVRGRTDTADALLAAAEDAADSAGIADAWMVLAAQSAQLHWQRGDREALAEVAALAEDFAVTEGVTEVRAEAASMWAGAGRTDRAAALVRGFAGDVLRRLPRDGSWLLTLQCVLEGAVAAEDREVLAAAAELAAPYEGRAVINGGAVLFHGVVDDTLARAEAMLGRTERAVALREHALATYIRLGATWWFERLDAWHPTPAAPTASSVVHLHPAGADSEVWLVGAAPGVMVRPLKGFGYLRTLVEGPGRAVPAVDLVSGGTATVLQPPTGALADRQALAAYRQRLRDLDEELAEAEDWADQGRLEVAHRERDALLAELGSAAGLGGRTRVTGSTQERARVAVTKAIGAAVERIAHVDADLGAHLRASVRTGTECVYTPPAGATRTWILRSPGA